MGAGAKSDPSRVQISDISYTVYDPLARSVRRRLRLLGVQSGIPVVYSTEAPGDVKLLPLPEEEFQKGDVKELGVLEDFRVRILPVLGEETLESLVEFFPDRSSNQARCHRYLAYTLRHTFSASSQENRLPTRYPSKTAGNCTRS
jgi:hypothetical protein